jgi:hypothetical protein
LRRVTGYGLRGGASVRLCVCASVRLCVCASVRLCVCASVRLCVCASVRRCIGASVRRCGGAAVRPCELGLPRPCRPGRRAGTSHVRDLHGCRAGHQRARSRISAIADSGTTCASVRRCASSSVDLSIHPFFRSSIFPFCLSPFALSLSPFPFTHSPIHPFTHSPIQFFAFSLLDLRSSPTPPSDSSRSALPGLWRLWRGGVRGLVPGPGLRG